MSVSIHTREKSRTAVEAVSLARAMVRAKARFTGGNSITYFTPLFIIKENVSSVVWARTYSSCTGLNLYGYKTCNASSD